MNGLAKTCDVPLSYDIMRPILIVDELCASPSTVGGKEVPSAPLYFGFAYSSPTADPHVTAVVCCKGNQAVHVPRRKDVFKLGTP